MYYLKILFIVSSLFIFNFSLATSTCKTVFPDIPEKVISYKNSVWKIEKAPVRGTGFFISPNQFVTNFHVMSWLHQFSPRKSPLERFLPNLDMELKQDGIFKKFKIKNIQKLSALHDLAILEIDGEVTNYLPLKNALSTKEDLFLISYPAGKLKIIKIEKHFSDDNSSYIFKIYKNKINGYKFNGASGSPILNAKGEVVGVLSGSLNNLFSHDLQITEIKFLQNLLQEKSEVLLNSLKNIEIEMTRLHKMAEQGDGKAQYMLGVYYKNRARKASGDKKEWSYWIGKAEEQGVGSKQTIISVSVFENKQDF